MRHSANEQGLQKKEETLYIYIYIYTLERLGTYSSDAGVGNYPPIAGPRTSE